MSFASSLSFVMDGSGIESVFKTVYGEDTVKHMLDGKAIAKALHAHCKYSSWKCSDFKASTNAFQRWQRKHYNTIWYNDCWIHGTNRDYSFIRPRSLRNGKCWTHQKAGHMGILKTHLSSESRTAKLWIQYREYVSIMRQFVRAARSGDWNLNLISLQRMLILFAATGHINYAKSGRLYLQLMIGSSK